MKVELKIENSIINIKPVINECDQLPNEILFEIFSFLKQGALANCCLVSKDWNKLSSHDVLWKNIFIREVFGQERWDSTIKTVKRARSIDPDLLRIFRLGAPNNSTRTIGMTCTLIIFENFGNEVFLEGLVKGVICNRKNNLFCDGLGYLRQLLNEMKTSISENKTPRFREQPWQVEQRITSDCDMVRNTSEGLIHGDAMNEWVLTTKTTPQIIENVELDLDDYVPKEKENSPLRSDKTDNSPTENELMEEVD